MIIYNIFLCKIDPTLQQNIAQAGAPTSNQTLLLSTDHPASLLQQHGAPNLGIGNLISGLPPQSNSLNAAASAIQQSQLINQLGAPLRQTNSLLNPSNNSRQPGAQNENISSSQNMMLNLGGGVGNQPNNLMMGPQQQLLLTNGPNPNGSNSLLFRANGIGQNLNQKNLPTTQQQHQQLNLNNSQNNGNNSNSNINSQLIQQQRIQQQSHLQQQQQQQLNNRPDMLKIPIYNSNNNANAVNNNNRNSQVII